MSGLMLGNHGGRSHCYRFFEDMMLCVKEEGIHRQMYQCTKPKEDYYECILHKKKVLIFIVFLCFLNFLLITTFQMMTGFSNIS